MKKLLERRIYSEDISTALFPATDHVASMAIPSHFFEERKEIVQAGSKETDIGKDP